MMHPPVTFRRAVAIAAVTTLFALPAFADEPAEPAVPAAETPPADEAARAAGADELVPPQIILSTQQPPIYPPAALAGRMGGTVTVRMIVLADGNVGTAEALDCDHPNLGFEDASIAAVKKWRFEPAMQDGEPVEFETTFRLNFRSGGKGGKRDVYVSAGADGGKVISREDRPSSSPAGDRRDSSLPPPPPPR